MSAYSKLLSRQTEQPTCTLYWICKQLGFHGSDVRRVRYVSALIAERGFPAPLPHEKVGGGISDEVSAMRSQWLRIGVENWLGDYLPPGASAALTAAEASAAAADMDAAAHRLNAGCVRIVAGTQFEKGAA